MDAHKTGTFIAELRQGRGLTQRQLAEALLVSDKAISRWETGRGLPDIENLEALAHALDVSVAELLRGERIVESVPAEEADELAQGSLELARRLWRQRAVGLLVAGFLVAAAVIALVAVYLTSPIYLEWEAGLVQVEKAHDGTLIALLDEDATGCELSWTTDPESGATCAFVSCYRTLWHGLTHTSAFGPHIGTWQGAAVSIGHEDAVDRVYYYPCEGVDQLLYTNAKPRQNEGVLTLPRLVYNGWLAVGLAASAGGALAWFLTRRRWYSRRVLRAALVPACCTVSLVVVLWGKFDQVYNAPFYLSGIVLVALALYGLALLVESRLHGAAAARV